MTAPELVAFGEVLPLRKGWPQEKHVIKHLYRRAQRWDFIVPDYPTEMRERLLQVGSERIARIQAGSDHHEQLGAACRKQLRLDHEAFYRPAYMHSVRTACELGRVGTLGRTSARWAYCGDNGVFVVASDGSDGRPPRVVSAYRKAAPQPETAPATEFIRATLRLWRDKTTLARSGQTTKDLESP